MSEEHHSHILSRELEAQEQQEVKRLWRKVQLARTILFISTSLNLLGFLFSLEGEQFDYPSLIFVLIYITLYIMAKKRPYNSLLAVVFVMGGALLYSALMIFTNLPFAELIQDPALLIFLGTLVFRLIILIFIIRGVIAAKKWEELVKGKFH
jgi:hypothetical protein